VVTEQQAFERIRDLDEKDRVSYATRGRICSVVKKQMLHVQRINPETGEPYTLSGWIRACSPWGYASSFAALRDFEALSDIPSSDLVEMPESSIKILTQLSTSVRSQPSVIAAAKTQRSDELIGFIQRDHPDQHISSRHALRIVLDDDQHDAVEKTIQKAMDRGAMSRAEALMDICLNYQADVLLEEMAEK
jgi:hypothetical protein